MRERERKPKLKRNPIRPKSKEAGEPTERCAHINPTNSNRRLAGAGGWLVRNNH